MLLCLDLHVNSTFQLLRFDLKSFWSVTNTKNIFIKAKTFFKNIQRAMVIRVFFEPEISRSEPKMVLLFFCFSVETKESPNSFQFLQKLQRTQLAKFTKKFDKSNNMKFWYFTLQFITPRSNFSTIKTIR